MSIQDTCADLQPQIVVVDGGSFDGCGEMLAADFREVVFVQSNDNVGFGRANNLGFERVNSDVVLLLNPDTELKPGAVHGLLAELERNPGAGMVGPRLLNSDLTLQTSVQALPKPIRQAFDSEILRRLLWPLRLWAPPTDYVPDRTIAVEATSGACMLLRSSTFRLVGGFTPAYFMYAEDMDLCFKVLREGFTIYHVPSSEVIHHSGASSSSQGSTFSAVMMREALHLYMKLNHGVFYAWLYRAATGIVALLRLLILALPAAIGRSDRRFQRKLVLSRWRSVLSWSFGQQKWTKRYG